MKTVQRRRPWRRVFGAASVIALVAGALAMPSCGSSFLDGLSGGRLDGGSGGPDVEVGGDARECNSALAPEKPADPDDPTNISLTFAMEGVLVGTAGSNDSGVLPPRGLDLDRTCTCPEPESCVRPKGGERVCDADGGRDNALGTFFSLVSVAIKEFKDDFATLRIRDGTFTMLVQVSGWNGKPNDPSVNVQLLMSAGFDKAAFDGGRSSPVFDGTDVWTVDPNSIVSGDQKIGKDCQGPGTVCVAKLLDAFGYVREGKLVAKLAEADSPNGTASIVIRTSVGRIVFDLVATKLVADLSGDAVKGYRLDGELVGRWPVESVLSTIANVENPFRRGESLCKNGNDGYKTTKASVCNLVDIASDPARDGTGVPCTAVSSALSFTAGKAVVGRVNTNDAPDSSCGDWKDDCESNPFDGGS